MPGGLEGGGMVVDAYLRIHGPATPGEVAAYLQTIQRAVKPDWPDGSAEVRGRPPGVAARGAARRPAGVPPAEVFALLGPVAAGP